MMLLLSRGWRRHRPLCLRHAQPVVLHGGQSCFTYGPNTLRFKQERSHFHNCGADIQTKVCATRETRLIRF